MTPKQRKFRADLIQIIHILKAEKGIDDEMYRAILFERYGVDSSTLLDIDELKDFAIILGYKGFETRKAKANREIESHIETTNRGTSTKTQIATILKMWRNSKVVRNKDIAGLLSYCNRILGYIPFSLGMMSKSDASKMINAIKNLK
ncbi:regulatory protein GemA [Campylobacter sp. RM9334]|uniref:regulatory protein GemA n=1 Tax=Campylobacter sp. RM9334 TaxID=2735732 RepID=UPI001D3E2847|nr:regulatory protein GemA [Campylobacter sp. RM9334]